MRTLLRSSLVAVLIFSLVETPVFASPSRALGVVSQAERARVGSGEAISGATIFAGDTLTTEAGGAVRVRVGSAQLYLQPESTARLEQTAAGLSAALERGTAIFSSGGPAAIELLVAGARIRPRTPEPTLGQITLVSAGEFLVTSQRGQLEMAFEDETYTVPEATSYRVVTELEEQGPRGVGSDRQEPKKAGQRRRLLPIILIFGGAGAGIGIWRAFVSPHSP